MSVPQEPTARPVATSSRNTDWQLLQAPAERVSALQHALSCPLPIAYLLATRALDLPDLNTFFEPHLSHLHSPGLLLGMEQAIRRIQHAVSASEPILIYGDYDVDGTTATVLLKTAIDRMVAARVSPAGAASLVTWHVPHRIREGYGMRAGRLAEAAAAGIRLVISVDTGTRAFAAAEEAKALGLDLIITDHHLPDVAAGVPEAVAVINPAQASCTYPFKHLCGAAVAFKLAHALLLAHAAAQPDPAASLHTLNTRLLPSFLKLVAIATIADSVPLIGENRIIAALGLRELANPVQPGLRALMQVASLPLDKSPSAADVGFRLGPRINAAGRMDIADDVIELFLTRSTDRAQELAAKLNDLNEARRATEREALDAIEQHLLTLLASDGSFPAECLILDHPDWHRGVLGILASRVVERTGRPALVLTHQEGEAHGSGRSIAGFHLLDSLTAAHTHADGLAPELFTRFGGHAHAVGLTLASDRLPLLRQRMRAISRSLLPRQFLAPSLSCDAQISPRDLTLDLVQWIDRCAPFGNAHPEPVFLLAGISLREAPRSIKERHLCLSLIAAPGLPPLQALAWSRATDWVAHAQALALTAGTRVDLACRIRARSSQWFTGIELDVLGLRLA